ncbi:unnamed protein product [Penicillium olsonii]|nr:unnamed protein product [Penicillium olsonii]
MQYIAENTTIPVPRIYRVEVQAGGIKSILMNYIDDRTLEEAWPSMIPSQKVSIAQELHGFILQLRDLTNGSDPEAGGQRFRDLQTKNLMTSLSTECDYQSTVPSFFRMGSLFPDNSHWSSSVSRKDNLFFTHGDLAPRNILVSQEGHVTAVLDWEYAGWYPEWWEAVKAYEFCNDLPGWAAYLSIILPPSHATEYMTMALATRFVR